MYQANMSEIKTLSLALLYSYNSCTYTNFQIVSVKGFGIRYHVGHQHHLEVWQPYHVQVISMVLILQVNTLKQIGRIYRPKTYNVRRFTMIKIKTNYSLTSDNIFEIIESIFIRYNVFVANMKKCVLLIQHFEVLVQTKNVIIGS